MFIRSSFSSKFGRGLDVEAILLKCEDYKPTSDDLSIDNYQKLLRSIQDINNTETRYLQESKELTDARNVLFNIGQYSVMRLFSGLKTYVGWKYGIKSTEYKLLDTIWGRMVKSGNVSAVTGDENLSGDNNASEEQKTRKDAERTFAAMSKNLADFVTTIAGFKDFNPDLEVFKLESLNTKLTTVLNFNKDIAAKKLQLTLLRKERTVLYKELKEKTDRIKSNIKAQYGADSEVYIQISSLKF